MILRRIVVPLSLACLVAAGLLLSACSGGSDQRDGDKVVARLGDIPITQKMVDAAIVAEGVASTSTPVPEDPAYRRLFSMRIAAVTTDVAAAAEAERMKVKVSAEAIASQLKLYRQLCCQSDPARWQDFLATAGISEQALVERIRLAALVQGLQASRAKAKAPISDADLRATWRRNRDSFRRPESREVGLIVTPTREAAAAALGDLAKGATFEEVARKVSKDLSGPSGGRLAISAQSGYPPALLKQALSFATGSRSKAPLQIGGRWYIVEAFSDTLPASNPSYEDALPQIRAMIEATRGVDAWKAYLAQLTRSHGTLEYSPGYAPDDSTPVTPAAATP